MFPLNQGQYNSTGLNLPIIFETKNICQLETDFCNETYNKLY